MGIKRVPAHDVVTCDCCGRTGEPRVAEGSIHIYQHLIDWHGHAAASGNMKLFFCDYCHKNIVAAINGAVESLREAIK